MTMATALAPWRERNPLRRWRLAENVTVADTALMLGVSTNTTTKWERGGGTPAPMRMVRLARVTGNKHIAQEWHAWQREQSA